MQLTKEQAAHIWAFARRECAYHICKWMEPFLGTRSIVIEEELDSIYDNHLTLEDEVKVILGLLVQLEKEPACSVCHDDKTKFCCDCGHIPE